MTCGGRWDEGGGDAGAQRAWGFLPVQGLTTEVRALAHPGEGLRRDRRGGFPAQHAFEAFDDEVFDGSAAGGGSDLRPLKKAVGQIYGRFHMAINAGICLRVAKQKVV